MRFAFVAEHRTVWPLSRLRGAPGVSRSGFHAWLTRRPGRRALDDERIAPEVQAGFLASDRTRGARRVWRGVLAGGVERGPRKVERLMRGRGLRARPRRRSLPPGKGEWAAGAAPANILDRRSEAQGPNREWVADFTRPGPPRAGSTPRPSSACSPAASSAGR